MATLTIRKLDDSIKQSLCIQAAHHGVSIEEEARRIFQNALIQSKDQGKLGLKIHRHFAQVGGVDEGFIPARSTPRPTPDFTGARE
ncbi:MAG: plasmid stabilization protein [Desulfobulbaceae bacterium]|nr:plasmid stabilization protein [Desulfobulbaceae bacterium]